MDLDEILHEVGENGKYQNLMLWFVFLPAHLTFGCHAYSQLFMMWTPDHWCQVPELGAANLSEHLIRHLTVPPHPSGTGYSRCSMYKLDYSIHTDHNTIILKEPNTNWTNVTCNKGWIYNTSGNWDRDTAVTKWDLVCSKKWFPMISLTAFNASGLLGQCICLLVAAKFGKRVLFFGTLVVQSAGGLATAFSPNFICFIVFRCLVGLTIPAVLLAPSSLAIELSGVKSHGRVTLLCSAVQSFGTALLAGIVLFVGDWSNLALASSVPFLVFLLYGWVFPESPKWLLETGRYEETGRLLRNIATTNGRSLSPDYVVSLKRRFRVEIALQEDKHRDTGGHSLCDLLSTSNMRRKVIIMIFVSSFSSTACLGLTYYSIYLPSEKSIQLNFTFCAAAEVVAVAMTIVTLRCAGRRCSTFLFCALSGVVCLLHAFSTAYLGWMISLISYFIAKFFAHTSNIVLHLWTREQLPVVTRESGLHFIETISLIGPIAVPIIIFKGEENPHLPMCVFGGLFLFCAILCIGLPETKYSKNLQTLHDAEMFGKYWKWKDYLTSGPTKSDHKNGILKSLEKRPQSPILGLLRKRDSFHLANAEGEIEVFRMQF
ncbi:beta-alanine transporter-like [Uloborus diversus]|uniref:beta-alanine transporter-like n=1 Tax=Uloborus diversus TaxID=327109 RepID=UPI00240A011A|nr:beta-alanine transporter-like [Uloborus diversus]